MTTDFAKRLDQCAEDTEAVLARVLNDTLLPDEIARPKRLMDAMRYSSLGGGKRLRPFLVVESSAVFGVPREAALLAGAALECIHCYSLIHDDLPAMDNSDLRRGRPTLHQATDDATASERPLPSANSIGCPLKSPYQPVLPAPALTIRTSAVPVTAAEPVVAANIEVDACVLSNATPLIR